MRKLLFTGSLVLALALPAIAQDAQVGKEYDIVIASEDSNQYVGAFGQAKIGSVVLDVPDAKKDQKYHVKVTEIKKNQYTGDTQASCSFQLTGGDKRMGMCIPAA
jgi:predicted RNA-binding protein with TRAM domain